uniref:Uncharacterized protein n=1 Tax=Tetraselmis sp. GSL018 TaxID=582737 RepID=A0A061R3F9_9CHLO|mmetsp:Transcript_2516/g.5985  ORF Transcript_2516/g.5985 Transcript_2516/m.5985 type:complete len:323 (-) Transcript_2516:54-1022(-)|eukprot:CAMPEP_0177604882 /NCGR_PEP_ID=MMETSP0419_2-20121207/16373_1 /TAXON_ID=582737 /ORGANISM="Tetraselmis sp., Strain GSL018" /LENGTH=322 /DNA_ID=CAMNT_0019098931 /DNA_START=171 /DNA_END=1139 /DNA_ORIENTATION=+
MVRSTSDRCLESASSLLAQSAPFIEKLGELYNACEPYVESLWNKSQAIWRQLEPYHPEEFLPALFGLSLVFFGGTFMTLLACIEAYRITGWKPTVEALKVLALNYTRAMEANAKDNRVDADGNGIPDVKEADAAALATRKLRLLLKSTDPEQLERAVSSIASGFMAVVASLRIKFAKAIALGCSIGDAIDSSSAPIVSAVAERALPPEMHKWIPLARRYAARGVGVSFAWWLTRVVSAVYSAVRGSQLLVHALLGYAIRHGHLPKDAREYTDLLRFSGLGLAFIGFWLQLRGGFALSFPFNVLLLPVTLAEWFLQYFVGIEV